MLHQCVLNSSKLQEKSKVCKLEESPAQVQLQGHQICSVSQITNNTTESTEQSNTTTEVHKPTNKMSFFRSSKKKEKSSTNSLHRRTSQQKTSSKTNSAKYPPIPPPVDIASHPLRLLSENNLHSSTPNLAPKQSVSRGNSPLSTTPVHKEQLHRPICKSQEYLDSIHMNEKHSSQVQTTLSIETNDDYSRLRILEDPTQKGFDRHISKPRPGDYSRLNIDAIERPSGLDDIYPQTDEECSEVVTNHHYFTLEVMDDKNDTQSLDPQPDEELSDIAQNHHYFTLEDIHDNQSHENYLLETSPTPHDEETTSENTSSPIYSYVEIDLKGCGLVPGTLVNSTKDQKRTKDRVSNSSRKQKTRDVTKCDDESHYDKTSHTSGSKKDLLNTSSEEITPSDYLLPTRTVNFQTHSQKPFPMLRTSSARQFQYRTKHTSPSPPPLSSSTSPISNPCVNKTIQDSFTNSLYSNTRHISPTTSSRQKRTSPLYDQLRHSPPSINQPQTSPVGHYSELRRGRIHSDTRHNARSPPFGAHNKLKGRCNQLHEINAIDHVVPLSPQHNPDEYADMSDDDVVLSPFLPDISSPNGHSDTESVVDDKTKEQKDSQPHDSHVRLIITDNGPILLPRERSLTNPNFRICRTVSSSDEQPRSSSASSNRIEENYEIDPNLK